MKRKIFIVLIWLKIIFFLFFIFPQVSEGEGKNENDLVSLIIKQRELIVAQRNSCREKIGGLIDSLNIFDSKEIKLSYKDEEEIEKIYISLLICSFLLETFLKETEEKKNYFFRENLSSYNDEEQSEILSKLKAQLKTEERLEEAIKKIEEQIDSVRRKYFRPI